MSLLKHAPQFEPESAIRIAGEFYDLKCSATSLPSERDQNFLLTTPDNDKFVLKIANALEERLLLDAQNAVMNHLGARVEFCPRLILTRSGQPVVEVASTESVHLVRLITYINGEPLAQAIQSNDLLFDLGAKLGQLSRALEGFERPAFRREFHWDLANGPNIVDKYVNLLTPDLRRVIAGFKDTFIEAVGSRLHKLPRWVIHGDANDYNVIVDNGKVVGLIDLGDMVWSYRVGELAIALAYVVLGKADPLSSAKAVVDGYLSECELHEDELAVLWWLMLMRLAMSVCLAAHQQKENPQNDYLDISQQAIRSSLPGLLALCNALPQRSPR